MRKSLNILIVILIIVLLGLTLYFYILPKFGSENRRIDSWIKANHLNKYGDPKNTAYSNGKPCDNTLDCYNYIKKTYPDKPWEK